MQHLIQLNINYVKILKTNKVMIMNKYDEGMMGSEFNGVVSDGWLGISNEFKRYSPAQAR